MTRRRLAAGCAVVLAAGLVVSAAAAATNAARSSSGHPAVSKGDRATMVRTPRSSPRPRTSAPARPAALSDAGRLAAPACATLADARAGRFPDAVLARGSRRALAHVAQSVAAALVGLPVLAPAASLPAHRRLDRALTRLSDAIAAGDDRTAAARAAAIGPRITDYASALGIERCG